MQVASSIYVAVCTKYLQPHIHEVHDEAIISLNKGNFVGNINFNKWYLIVTVTSLEGVSSVFHTVLLRRFLHDFHITVHVKLASHNVFIGSRR